MSTLSTGTPAFRNGRHHKVARQKSSRGSSSSAKSLLVEDDLGFGGKSFRGVAVNVRTRLTCYNSAMKVIHFSTAERVCRDHHSEFTWVGGGGWYLYTTLRRPTSLSRMLRLGCRNRCGACSEQELFRQALRVNSTEICPKPVRYSASLLLKWACRKIPRSCRGPWSMKLLSKLQDKL